MKDAVKNKTLLHKIVCPIDGTPIQQELLKGHNARIFEQIPTIDESDMFAS